MTPFKLQRYLIWFYHGMRWKGSISWLEETEKRNEISNMTVGCSIWAVYTGSCFVLCRIHWSLSALQTDVSMFFQSVSTCVPNRTVWCLRVYGKVFTDTWKLQMLLLLSRLRIETVISRVRVRCITARFSVGYSTSKTPLTAGLYSFVIPLVKKVTDPVVSTVWSVLLISLRGRDMF